MQWTLDPRIKVRFLGGQLTNVTNEVIMIRVLPDRFLVEEQKQSYTTKSGLYIPETSQEGQVISGTVVALSGLRSDGTRSPIEDGMTVWFNKFNAFKVEIDKKQYYSITEKDILAYSIPE